MFYVSFAGLGIGLGLKRARLGLSLGLGTAGLSLVTDGLDYKTVFTVLYDYLLTSN